MKRLVAFVGAMALAGAAWGAQSPGQKCETGKNMEAGKYASCLHKAEAKLLKTKGTCSVTSATVCYGDEDCPTGETCSKDLTKYGEAVAKCENKFEAKWNKLTQTAADKGGLCPDGLQQTDVKAVVDDCVANVAGGLAGDGLSSGDDCGNGVVDAGEDCDLGNLNGGTCAGEGFAGGDLRCGAGCVYNASECYAARFVDNADGTITDNETGLMWEKKVKLDATTDFANLQDVDNVYRWAGTCSVNNSKLCQPDAASSTACFAGVEGDTTGCDECAGADGTCMVTTYGTIWQWLNELNAANYGGHSDWRVPLLQELATLVDFADATVPITFAALHGDSCGASCIDLGDPECSCTQIVALSSPLYWSATTEQARPIDVWFVDFETGFVYTGGKTPISYVRAVRGGS